MAFAKARTNCGWWPRADLPQVAARVSRLRGPRCFTGAQVNAKPMSPPIAPRSSAPGKYTGGRGVVGRSTALRTADTVVARGGVSR